MAFEAQDLVKDVTADGDNPCRFDCCLWKPLKGVFGDLPYFSVTEENKMKCKHCGEKVHYLCLYAYTTARMAESWAFAGDDWKKEKKLSENALSC